MLKQSSAKELLIRMVVLFVAPFFLFLGILITYTGIKYSSETVAAEREQLVTKLGNLYDSARACDRALSNIAGNNKSFFCLSFPLSDTECYLNVYEVKKLLSVVLNSSDKIDAALVYASENDRMDGVYSSRVSLQEAEAFRTQLRAAIREGEKPSGWKIGSFAGSYFLYKMIGNLNAHLVYATRLDSCFEAPNEGVLFFTDGRIPLSSVEKAEKLDLLTDGQMVSGGWMEVAVPSEYFGLSLVSAKPYRGIWNNQMLLFLCLATLVFIAISILDYRAIRRRFLDPLSILRQTMETIQSGKLNERVHTGIAVLEYDAMRDTFNAMLDRIQELHELAYEKQREAQQAQLQFYQIQIRPHFFLNCLKIINGQAQTQSYKHVQETIVALSEYIRAVFSNKTPLIKLSAELESVQSVIKLHQTFGAVQLHYHESVPAALGDFPVPPLLLLTFIENALAYAPRQGAPLQIAIKATVLDDAEERFVNLTISDNGVGFPEDVLGKLNRGDSLGRIGIKNVRERLRLLYGERAALMFANCAGGRVEVYLPAASEGGDVA